MPLFPLLGRRSPQDWPLLPLGIAVLHVCTADPRESATSCRFCSSAGGGRDARTGAHGREQVSQVVCPYVFFSHSSSHATSQIMVRCARSISRLQSAEGGSLQALLCPPPSALLSFPLSLPLLELPNYTSKFPYNWSFDSGRRVPQLRTYVSRASQRFSYMYLSGAGDRASETPCADIRTRRERRMYVWNVRTAASRSSGECHCCILAHVEGGADEDFSFFLFFSFFFHF